MTIGGGITDIDDKWKIGSLIVELKENKVAWTVHTWLNKDLMIIFVYRDKLDKAVSIVKDSGYTYEIIPFKNNNAYVIKVYL